MNIGRFSGHPVGAALADNATDLDPGLRRYVLSVYNAMAAGLAFTGLVAYFAVATSLARVFFIGAVTFAAISLCSYSTRRDLSRFGSFLLMGLIGIVLAGIVNIFVGSSTLQFAISVIGVLLFTGLTAFDTQRIKQVYLTAGVAEDMTKPALTGALTLHLDFIDLFVMLLRRTTDNAPVARDNVP